MIKLLIFGVSTLLCRVISVEKEGVVYKHTVVTQYNDTGVVFSHFKRECGDTIKIPYEK